MAEGGKSDSNPKDIISSMLHSAQKKIRANIDKSKDRSRDSIETDLPDIEPESFSFFNEKDTHKEVFITPAISYHIHPTLPPSSLYLRIPIYTS